MTADASPTGLSHQSLKLLTTGGTIATRVDEASGRSRPSLGGLDLANLLQHGERIQVRELDRRPSWTLTLDEMAAIAMAVDEEAKDAACHGLVVTVGTSALEYLAYVIDLLVETPKPVVVTGAMLKADDGSPDGPGNLEDALVVAGSPQAHNRGVLVSFAGRVLTARGVYKRHRGDVDAFVDLNGHVATVAGQEVTWLRRSGRPIRLVGPIDPTVEVIKIYPGAPGALFDAARLRGARGVVIEALPGAGGIPPAMLPAIQRLIDDQVAVVVSSRAPYGRVSDPPTGGTGSPLAELPLLSSGDLTAEKAWVLLSVVLGQSSDKSSASALFQSMVRGNDD